MITRIKTRDEIKKKQDEVGQLMEDCEIGTPDYEDLDRVWGVLDWTLGYGIDPLDAFEVD